METTTATAAETGVSHAGESMVALHSRRASIAYPAECAATRRILPLKTLRSETFTGLPGGLATPKLGCAAARPTPKSFTAPKSFR